MNFRQKVAVAVLDVVLIAEVCISLYLGNQEPDRLTPVFLKSFFAMVIPTLIIARIVIKRMRTPEIELTQ